MIVQDFHLKRYKWHVRVYYAVHRYWTEDIVRDLRDAGCRGSQLMTARENLRRGELNTGITYSNFGRRETVMVVSLTSTAAEFLNSWMHEMQHLCRHVAAAFGIDPYCSTCADTWRRPSGLTLTGRRRLTWLGTWGKGCSRWRGGFCAIAAGGRRRSEAGGVPAFSYHSVTSFSQGQSPGCPLYLPQILCAFTSQSS